MIDSETSWSQHADDYEQLAEPLTLPYARKLVDQLGVSVGDAVLDIGCGTGAAAVCLAERGARVHAIDFAEAMVSRTRDRLAACTSGTTFNVDCMDGQALTIDESSKDAVVSNFGVVLFPEFEKAIQEMLRVVRPGGRFGLTSWVNPSRLNHMAKWADAVREVADPHFEFPQPIGWIATETIEKVTDLFRMLGVVDIEIREHTTTCSIRSVNWFVERFNENPLALSVYESFAPQLPRKIGQRFRDLLGQSQEDGPFDISTTAIIATASIQK